MVRKCEDCKHSSFFGAAFVGRGGSSMISSTTCKLKNKKVEPEGKCWRFIKRGGKVEALQKHWLSHWKFYVGTIISLLLGGVGLLIAFMQLKPNA